MSLVKLVQEFGSNLIKYSPVIVSCLFVYHRESKANLQVLHAFEHCRVPDETRDTNAPREDIGDGEVKRIQEPRFAVLKSSALVALVLIIVLFDFTTGTTLRMIFYLCTVSLPLSMAVILARHMMAPSPLIHRAFNLGNDYGVHLRIRVTVQKIDCILSPLVVTAAVLFEYSFLVLIVYMSILLILISIFVPLRITIARIFPPRFKVYFWIAVVMCIVLLLVFIGRIFLQSSVPEEADGLRWSCIILSILLLLLPFDILCMFLHLDYTAALYSASEESSDLSGAHINLENLPTPYHSMAYCIFSCSLFGLVVLSTMGAVSLKLEEFGFLAVSVAIPSMVCGSLVLAAKRGQLKELWEHEESIAAAHTGGWFCYNAVGRIAGNACEALTDTTRPTTTTYTHEPVVCSEGVGK